MGLGAGGNRLLDVARNIPSVQANNPPVVNPISAPVLAAGAFGASLNNVMPAQLGESCWPRTPQLVANSPPNQRESHLFAASALSNTNAAALQASLAGGLGANLTTSSLLNSSLTNELASNLNNFGGGVGGLSGLQASLAGQGNNSFAPRGLSKLDNDIGFGGNNAFGGSNFGGGRDFDGGFNRGDGDRVSAGGGGGFSGNQGQTGGGNRQNSNGSRSMSDTILICNVRFALSSEL